MRGFIRFSRIILILFITAFLASSCATSANCRGNKGGWYAKDRNLGPVNKPIKYKR